jgi:hypothetical protein
VSAAKEALEQAYARLSTSLEDTTAQLRAAEEESEKLKTSETELRQELEVSLEAYTTKFGPRFSSLSLSFSPSIFLFPHLSLFLKCSLSIPRTPRSKTARADADTSSRQQQQHITELKKSLAKHVRNNSDSGVAAAPGFIDRQTSAPSMTLVNGASSSAAGPAVSAGSTGVPPKAAVIAPAFSVR